MQHLKSLLSQVLYGMGFCLALLPHLALAEHRVSVTRPDPVSTIIHLALLADVLDTSGSDDSIPRLGRSYNLAIQLPSGVTPDLTPGSSIDVALPTIHHSKASAVVKAVSKARIELVLPNQVQLLDGQRLRVTLPLKPLHLFRIPFQAVYSPRGLTTEVF